MIYYIYEVPGEKNGATKQWEKRRAYNFNRYQIEPIIVETMEGPDTEEYWQVVGDREWYYADLNGYPRGTHYRVATLQSIVAGRKAATITPVSMFSTTESRSKGGKQSMKDKRIITFDIAEEIRKEYVPQKVTYKMLGEKYGCSWNTVRHIVKGWSYLEA